MSLIEVTTSLAILGTLLVASILAKGRLTRQSTEALVRLDAAHAADQLMQDWWDSPEGMPRNGRGTLDSDTRFQWRTESRPVVDDLAARLGQPAVKSRQHGSNQGFYRDTPPSYEIIRLEISPVSQRDDPSDSGVLASVEVLVPALSPNTVENQ
ncbi:MAG: hypothetical protein AAGC72_08125 [Planctomycetota bacterium]